MIMVNIVREIFKWLIFHPNPGRLGSFSNMQTRNGELVAAWTVNNFVETGQSCCKHFLLEGCIDLGPALTKWSNHNLSLTLTPAASGNSSKIACHELVLQSTAPSRDNLCPAMYGCFHLTRHLSNETQQIMSITSGLLCHA